ncbi:LacI family DNA-binding transcriptional regulator [Cerasicoccus frondis]|uniref:LacI family DNA-binding transcriptional regulator n=1 Tax=Cerasicoccus frondis TaxID=490090 RepID=UPI002852B31E|nr:LacI family DNA-binding transcriptional regulator [Cerasicoccus frondis]
MPPKRVTLRDIAERADVHVTTVSLAMRNSPSLLPETRKRIQKLAKEMGYSPDPALSALQAYRRINHVKKSNLGIAYLSFNPTNDWKQVGPSHFEIYSGCQKRCEELGYHMELIWVKDPRLTTKRLTSILRTRNPAGLVLSARHGGRGHFRLNLDNYSAVRVDQGLVHPRLHAVSNNQFQIAQLAVRKAYHLGYRRVGLALMSTFNEQVNCFWSGGFWSEQQKKKAEQWVVPHLPSKWGKEPFVRWFEDQRPDVVISNHADNTIPQWLNEIGLRIPEDVGFIQLSMTDTKSKCAGVMENNLSLGRTIIDKLVAVIHRNERGIPECPELTLIDGTWIDGDTVQSKANR